MMHSYVADLATGCFFRPSEPKAARSSAMPAEIRQASSGTTVRVSLFFAGNREIFKKNREAIEHERAITERD